ncbi:MAG: two-component regulator propeller domain-containing protein [Algoriphagus sp.]|uniref:ligand-binding sensor domain-containing protein n=1 Tax=Algoriphagus sp. TaxID=1872435 RepID=UPI00273116F3|nr:sensor histidine kinase [Algoriphagus sp.]MDP2042919.1 two-component regulator propeller domain-containing protein [Algoriphagus sp.]MDP3473416.1 two-component regulator propeller domain-containing protein [Algoriphagus sp.]
MKKLLFLGLLLFVAMSLVAETKRFFVNRFGLAEGLSANQVLTIHQDHNRFLWIGTPNGLQRFDGRKFMTYQIKIDGVTQPSLPVYEIQEDESGKMWLRVGQEYGIYVPETEQFTPFSFEKNRGSTLDEVLWMDRKGNVFVVLKGHKILWLNPKTGLISDQNSLIKIPDGWRPNSVFEDVDGRYWVSCIEGIAVYDPELMEIFTSAYNPLKLEILNRPDFGYVVNTYVDGQGLIWVNYWAPDEFLMSYNPKTKIWKNHKSEIDPGNDNYQEAYGMIVLPGDRVWRYGIQTLADFDRSSGKFNKLVQSDLNFDKITQAVWDVSGGIWLGTDQGLYFLHFETPDIYFQKLDTGDGNNELQAIREIIYQGDTTIWVGSWGKGLRLFKPQTGELNSSWLQQNQPKSVEFRQVWDLHYDEKRGLIWVGLQFGNLQIVDLKTKKSTWIRPDAFDGSTIRTITEDAQGHLWFGTQRGGIVRYSGGGLDLTGFQRIRNLGGIIPKLIVSKDQKLWVTTVHDGVYVLDLEEGKVLKHLDQTILSSNKIEKIYQLNDSIFLMGFELLNKYNVLTGKNQVFSYSDGMVSNVISHIESDKSGLVWIYTPNGMTRFDALSNSFSSFGKNHFFYQLPSDGYSGTRFSDGQLAFVSNNAILIFDPLQFDRNLPPPRPTITGVSLFGKYVGDGTIENSKKKFDSFQNTIAFDFNLLNFPIQDRFVYFYRLVGADPNWIQAKSDFQAEYSLLPPGDYRFEVRAGNEFGFFSEAAGYDFEIRPSLVQTWWFKALMGLIFLGIIGLIYRLHVNRILAVVKLRSRLARDLHDDMGSTLSTINILSSMAKTKLGTDPAKSSEYISKISENSQRMMEAMDDIVWSIKPQNDSMEKLIARMREFANQVLESKDILFSMEIDDRVLGMKLSMDARRDLFLIFKEGINNAAKYSGASRVFISFGLDGRFFTMRIRDYGKGFDLKDLEEGNGLENMKKRAINLQGNLEIKTEPGQGTELVLKVNL